MCPSRNLLQVATWFSLMWLSWLGYLFLVAHHLYEKLTSRNWSGSYYENYLAFSKHCQSIARGLSRIWIFCFMGSLKTRCLCLYSITKLSRNLIKNLFFIFILHSYYPCILLVTMWRNWWRFYYVAHEHGHTIGNKQIILYDLLIWIDISKIN